MKLKEMKLGIVVLIAAFIIVASFSFAYLFKSGIYSDTGAVGFIEVNEDIYVGNHVSIPFAKVKGKPKLGVHELNVYDKSHGYYIDKLRVDFNVESNVDTFFRVRIYDALILKTVLQNVETEIPIPRDKPTGYQIGDDWYYDEEGDWYYYKNIVKKGDLDNVKFIVEGLDYGLNSPQYHIEFSVKVDAVQAYYGPSSNWGIGNPPWDTGGSWT
ncbi:MAG: hypothetical protein RBQ97_04185 [Acholeplasma sp.]|nr:hypothetical protein [Acholeplasma sp.]